MFRLKCEFFRILQSEGYYYDYHSYKHVRLPWWNYLAVDRELLVNFSDTDQQIPKQLTIHPARNSF